MDRPHIVLIAAVSDNGVIGRDGDMPWHLPDDLKRFKSITMGHPIVMGRRTWESIGRPLPGRTNIIMTRNKAFAARGASVAHSIPEVVEYCNDGTIMVIGGGEIYRMFLSIADRVELTRVHTTLDGDTTFPELVESDWLRNESTSHEADDRHAYAMTFESWSRTNLAMPK